MVIFAMDGSVDVCVCAAQGGKIVPGDGEKGSPKVSPKTSPKLPPKESPKTSPKLSPKDREITRKIMNNQWKSQGNDREIMKYGKSWQVGADLVYLIAM